MVAAAKATPIRMDSVIVQVYFLQINATSVDEKDRIKKLCKKAHSEMLASVGAVGKKRGLFRSGESRSKNEKKFESCYKKGIDQVCQTSSDQRDSRRQYWSWTGV